MALIDDVDLQRKSIRADGYPMSVGELVSMYREKELDIHPEFQRFFRWNPEQKSRFIESLLLGIPIPSIFVHQRVDGVWDVVDGLQRLSTIFEFLGVLLDENGQPLPSLELTATKLLPNLAGVRWSEPTGSEADETDDHNGLPASLRLVIRRSKLDFKIILRESDDSAKYELFQRLNTGGSVLSPQEVRNCILVMENRDFYQWLRGLANNEDFKNCLGLSDNAMEEQYDLELVVRLIILGTLEENALKTVGDLGEFLTDEIRRRALSPDFDLNKAKATFEETFSLLSASLGLDSFRRYYASEQKFKGGFLISAFEPVAMGIFWNLFIGKGLRDPLSLEHQIKGLWSRTEFTKGIGSGVRGSTRILLTVPIGRQLFSK